MTKKRELEQDLLSPKYKQKIEKSKKVKIREQEEKEAREEICSYVRKTG